MLEGRRLDSVGESAPYLKVAAAVSDRRFAVLTVNFMTEESSFRRIRDFLAGRGYDRDDLRRLGMSRTDLLSVLQGRRDLEGLGLSSRERADLSTAIALYERGTELMSSERAVVLEFVNVPYDTPVICERYLIDEENAGLSRERQRIESRLWELEELSKEPALEYLRSQGYSEAEVVLWGSDAQAAAEAYRQASGKRRNDLRAAAERFRQERGERMAQGAGEINRWDGVDLKPDVEECEVRGGKATVRVTLQPQAVSLIVLRPADPSN
jgi:hypothetical protein